MADRPDRLHRSLAASYLLIVVGLGTTVVLGELRRELSLSDTVTAAHGAFLGWFLLAGALAAPLLGRPSRRRLFTAAVLCLATGPLAVALAHHVILTLAGAGLAGLGGALLVIVVPGVVSDHHGADAPRRFSRINAWAAASGISFSLLVGACLAVGIGWRWPLGLVPVAFGMLTAALTIGAVFPTDHAPTTRHPLVALRSPAVRRQWWSIVLPTLCEFATAIWAVPLLRDVGGASAGAAPVLAALFGVGMMAGRLATDRHHTTAVVTASWLLILGGGCLMWLGPGLWGRAAGVLITGLGVAPQYPVAMGRLLALPAASARELSVVAALASGVAITVGPMLVGVVGDRAGLTVAPVVIPLLAAGGLVRCVALSRR